MSTPGPFKHAEDVIGWVIGLGALAAAIWAFIFALENHGRGIYAGFQYNSARNYAAHALAEKYGLRLAQQMRLATPDVVNTHFRGIVQHGQVRVFHLIGPRGVRYCVSVFNGGHDGQYKKDGVTKTYIADSLIIKGCQF